MPAKNAQTKSPILKNLTGGLNVREAISDIADNEAASATNIVYYTNGAIVRRGGWQKLYTNALPTTNPLTGCFQATFNTAGVFTYYTVITDGTNCWQTSSVAGGVAVWTQITGAVSMDATQPYHFLMMANFMIMYNGKAVHTWAGTGNLAALPNSATAAVIQDLTYTLVNASTTGVQITYTPGATAGAEVVTVTDQVINIKIASGTSTATQVKAAFDAVTAATNLATCSISGTAGTAQTSPASASFLSTIACPLSRVGIVWQNYLFWGGDATNPSRLYFSDLGLPRNYPTANFIDIPNPFDGEAITGLAILFGNLIILKRFSLYVLQGAPPSNLILSKLNSSVGCVEPASVIQVDNLVYFVSDKGLYAANLFNVRQVCYKVEPRYQAAVPYSTNANPIWAAHYKPRNQILISMDARSIYTTSQAKNDRIMAHDYFNADQSGDPAASEFIVGFTHYQMAAARPTYPTAPSIMADYFYPTSPSKSVSIMASFYDAGLYVFSEGGLAYGGPADDVSWLQSATYPPGDFLSKFFDFGDPDMTKQVRWLWTTAAKYNGVNLAAGIVYNNSPTIASFVNFNTDNVALRSAGGIIYLLGVDDDGALTTTQTTDATFVTTLVLADSNGILWTVTVDEDGTFITNVAGSTASSPPVFVSSSGFQYQMTVDTDGALLALSAFVPTTASITPGLRVPVLPLVNSIAGLSQGKYIQLYFTGIGVLVQYSLDLIMKGRRN